jgi:pSer/pThr/pTyr-binding forkhead associated (FHA) protein
MEQKHQLLEDRTYRVGRKDRRSGGVRKGPQARRPGRVETRIWLDHETVSNQHAEIGVLDGKIFLKDLNSTNGTYIFKDGAKVRITEDYVTLDQEVSFGQCVRTIRELLE